MVKEAKYRRKFGKYVYTLYGGATGSQSRDLTKNRLKKQGYLVRVIKIKNPTTNLRYWIYKTNIRV